MNWGIWHFCGVQSYFLCEDLRGGNKRNYSVNSGHLVLPAMAKGSAGGEESESRQSENSVAPVFSVKNMQETECHDTLCILNMTIDGNQTYLYNDKTLAPQFHFSPCPGEHWLQTFLILFKSGNILQKSGENHFLGITIPTHLTPVKLQYSVAC